MSQIRTAQWGALLLLAAAAQSFAAEPVYYVFEMDGKPIGYSEITADELTLDGQSLQRLRSTTTLKFALGTKTNTVVRRATTLVRPDTGVPTYYELTQDANGSINHVECKFEGPQVHTWQWTEGTSKGDPKDTQVTAQTQILGSNDFFHWGLLLKAAAAQPAESAAELTVFLPDVAQAQSFRLQRGESQNLDVAGTTHACQTWQLEGAGIEILTDAQSGQFVRMTIPAQKTTVLLADASIAQNAQQAPITDLLTRHFAQSNVVFDDSLKVTSLKATIDVSMIGEGVGQDAPDLQTAMQKFAGDVKHSSVTGTVTVQSAKYVASQELPFPSSDPADPQVASWLQPSPLIESDDAGIVAQAQELTQGAANRWQAVSNIAQWVHKEIRYTIADTPSARMALEKRQGDCGPHATLTVAMLRAVGIPAKLVGGLVYAPTLGGSFGQHAWVEVHMGADGWVAFDPTTGELDVLSATHIKLFEGLGGVIPAKVEVIAYEPANREIVAAARGAAKPLPWKFDTDFTYTYVQNGKKLGTEVFSWKKIQVDGRDCLELNSRFDVAAAGKKIHSATRLLTQTDAIPLLFHRDYDVDRAKSGLHCEFTPTAVKAQVTGPSDTTREVAITEGTYCFDNNLLPSFALICSQLDLQENQTIDIRTFHPTSLTVIPLSFQIKGIKGTPVAGANVECYECLVEPIKNTFWITADGRLVKIEAPGLVVEVSQ